MYFAVTIKSAVGAHQCIIQAEDKPQAFIIAERWGSYLYPEASALSINCTELRNGDDMAEA
jgi:hypothetical protein